MFKLLTLDSNVFISETKGDEEYSDRCGEIIEQVGQKFLLAEPTILLAEIGNAIARNISIEVAEERIEEVESMVSFFALCDTEICKRAGITGAKYNIYSADSLYLQAALDNSSVLVSLDEGIVLEVKDKGLPIETYHPKEFPYL